MTTSTFLRLCSRAPRTWMEPAMPLVLVWWFRSSPYCGAGSVANFGTENHTSKPRLAGVLIDSKVRMASDQGATNFRIGTPACSRDVPRLYGNFRGCWEGL